MKTSLCLILTSLFLFFSCNNTEEIEEHPTLNLTVEEGEILNLNFIKVDNDRHFFLEAESNWLKEDGVIDLPENGTYQISVIVDIEGTKYGDINIIEINEQKNIAVTLSPQDQVGSLKLFVQGNYSNKKLYAAVIVEETPTLPSDATTKDYMTNFINHAVVISDKMNDDEIIIENIPADSKTIDGYGSFSYLSSNITSAYCAVMVYDEDFTVSGYVTAHSIRAHEEQGTSTVYLGEVY
ncbi:hypothetical protein [Flammeovirga sp. SJP92]|uniref:hypothetical protein n=1 Tax=Flammeovirga sp. SJP92 TaxID=1775430 RepID=UPI0007989446|nr:hypothetical protein [Flammeovirga sp. SJP92]KXX67944.1 hypothetical protein AVL50_24105 [Flammeovirga sp. SJP92]